MENFCKICSKPIVKTAQKRGPSSREISNDRTHYHYGTQMFLYGTCMRNHTEKICLSKIVWSPCLRCGFTSSEDTLSSLPQNIKDEVEQLRLEFKL
jgi:hypothetical protein